MHHKLALAFGRRRPVPATQSVSGPNAFSAPCSTIERMPKWLICIPLAVQWGWLSLRYWSTTLPSAANPNLTAGGLVGEGKLEYFAGMGAHARSITAPYCAISTDLAPEAGLLQQKMSAAGLRFPVIAKPDLGLCGYGVQKVDDLPALLRYLNAFPHNEVVVLQQYLFEEGEAGIFYARDPETDQAQLLGVALRYFPRVVGDGNRAIAELIDADTRARRLRAGPQHAASYDLQRIPAAGETVRLATIGSTRVGGLYRDGAAYLSPKLTAAVDAVARDMPAFYCGRFDVRYTDLDSLREGRGFTIIEINGAGSEAIHAWDPEIGLFKAFRIIFAKQRILFEIGHKLRKVGARPIGLPALAALYRRQARLIAAYPPSN